MVAIENVGYTVQVSLRLELSVPFVPETGFLECRVCFSIPFNALRPWDRRRNGQGRFIVIRRVLVALLSVFSCLCKQLRRRGSAERIEFIERNIDPTIRIKRFDVIFHTIPIMKIAHLLQNNALNTRKQGGRWFVVGVGRVNKAVDIGRIEAQKFANRPHAKFRHCLVRL